MSIRKVVIPYLMNEKGQYFEEGDLCNITTRGSVEKGIIKKIHDYRILLIDGHKEIIIPLEAIQDIEEVK